MQQLHRVTLNVTHVVNRLITSLLVKLLSNGEFPGMSRLSGALFHTHNEILITRLNALLNEINEPLALRHRPADVSFCQFNESRISVRLNQDLVI